MKKSRLKYKIGQFRHVLRTGEYDGPNDVNFRRIIVDTLRSYEKKLKTGDYT